MIFRRLSLAGCGKARGFGGYGVRYFFSLAVFNVSVPCCGAAAKASFYSLFRLVKDFGAVVIQRLRAEIAFTPKGVEVMEFAVANHYV